MQSHHEREALAPGLVGGLEFLLVPLESVLLFVGLFLELLGEGRVAGEPSA